VSIRHEYGDSGDAEAKKPGHLSAVVDLAERDSSSFFEKSLKQETQSLVSRGMLGDLSIVSGDQKVDDQGSRTAVAAPKEFSAPDRSRPTGLDSQPSDSQKLTGPDRDAEGSEQFKGHLRESRSEQKDQPQSDAAKATSVTVQEGDTPWKIARRHLGENATNSEVQRHAEEIMRQNNISDPRRLRIGTQLMLPEGNAQDTSSTQRERSTNQGNNNRKLDNADHSSGEGSTQGREIDRSDKDRRLRQEEGNRSGTQGQESSEKIDRKKEQSGLRREGESQDQGAVTDAQIKEATRNQGIFRDIRRETDPETYTVQRGDNLWNIARRHLGQGASNAEIQNHVDEIARLNRIENPSRIREGAVIRLPGHDAQGNAIVEDGAGNRTTHGRDGSVRIENRDGSGYERGADGKERRWSRADREQEGDRQDGNRQDGNRQDGNRQDGDRQDQPRVDDATEQRENEGIERSPTEAMDAALNAARERMGENSPEFEQFQRDAREFAQRTDVSSEEIRRSFEQVERLLTAERATLSQQDRNLLAQNFMHHAKDPSNIDQGAFNTCNATTMQERLFSRNPSIAAEMLATTAIDGKWTAPDGKVVTIDPASLVPMPESRLSPPADGSRSFATQIMNNVLINDMLQRRNPPQTYSQISMNPDGTPLSPGDNGERLYDNQGNEVRKPDGSFYRAPGVFSGEMSQAMRRLTGDSGTVISNPSADPNENLSHVRSAEELGRTLEQMQREGRLPAIILIDADHPSFGGTGDGTPGWHVVTVRGYNPETGEVDISNQWGAASDRSISLQNLFDSTTDHSRTRTRSLKSDGILQRTNSEIEYQRTSSEFEFQDKKNFDWGGGQNQFRQAKPRN